MLRFRPNPNLPSLLPPRSRMSRNLLSIMVLLSLASILHAGEPARYDIVVYGGTGAAVAAAVEAARSHRSVILISPDKHLGGLTSGGLGATDIGNKAAIGGLAREFYHNIWLWYQDPAHWPRGGQDRLHHRHQGIDADTMWCFEPHVAEALYENWVREYHIPVVRERLDLAHGVIKNGPRILSLTTEAGHTYPGDVFIDATYEGDLMAKAGVSYTVGREANSQYHETLNGVQTAHARSHQFIRPVDPYIKSGDPTSGVLPFIRTKPLPPDGSADRGVQAYNYRLCATDDPDNRIPWPKPAHYNPAEFELALRNIEAGDTRIPWNPIPMPNRKTDSNNNFATSTDFIGQSLRYPDADYAERDQIARAHKDWELGLMWTLANNPRVPQKIRDVFQKWGLARDEFADNDHWPYALYVREARRMVGPYVMTEANCRGTAVADDPIALGAYNMDSHNVWRYIDSAGHVRNEGDVEVHVPGPYPIAYRAITPKAAECTNLLVPLCLSSTHIAFGSIRMEPVFMELGQSAAAAAVLAVEEHTTVQNIRYPKLREKLRTEKQVLHWPAARKK